MANKPIIERRDDLTVNKIVRFYQVFKSARKAAAALGLTHKTVTKYLRKAGVDYNKAGWDYVNTLGLQLKDRSDSQLVRWIKNNPDKLLPRSYKGIAEITGVSYSLVQSQIYKAHKRLQTWVRNHLKNNILIKKAINLKAISREGEDYSFNTGILSNYTVAIDKWTCNIYIIGEVKTQDVDYTVTFYPVTRSELELILDNQK